MMLSMLLLACGPELVRTVNQLDGEWAGTSQLGASESSSWREGKLSLGVLAEESTASVVWEATGYFGDTGSDDALYTESYACSIFVPRPGFVRLMNCNVNLNSAPDSESSGELVFIESYRDGDRLYLGSYILNRLSAEDAALASQNRL